MLYQQRPFPEVYFFLCLRSYGKLCQCLSRDMKILQYLFGINFPFYWVRGNGEWGMGQQGMIDRSMGHGE